MHSYCIYFVNVVGIQIICQFLKALVSSLVSESNMELNYTET